MSVLPVAWNSDAATTSIVRLIRPASPIAIPTSTRWKRSSERRSASSRGVIRPCTSALCRYTTCGITVAPRMPTASITLSVPSNPGTNPPRNALVSTDTCERS